MFIPQKINVGFQNRNDTYSSRLAYVIYYDEKGDLRKEGSWNSWRDSNIPNEEYENIPIEGFVLNKKAGGNRYSWNPRQTYVRVYDPRGWEFELTVPNLLFILENTNSIKGKGLEGEFVYSWDGKDLVLLPVNSNEYKESKAVSNNLFNKTTIKAADLREGYTYLDKKGTQFVYLGKYLNHQTNKKCFWFGEFLKYNFYIISKTSVSNFLISEDYSIDGKHPDFLDIIDLLEHTEEYSPIDESKCVIEPISYKIIEEELKNGKICFPFQESNNLRYNVHGEWLGTNNERKFVYNGVSIVDWNNNYNIYKNKTTITFKEFYDRYKPYRKHIYLQNGNYLCSLDVGKTWKNNQVYKNIKRSPNV